MVAVQASPKSGRVCEVSVVADARDAARDIPELHRLDEEHGVTAPSLELDEERSRVLRNLRHKEGPPALLKVAPERVGGLQRLHGVIAPDVTKAVVALARTGGICKALSVRRAHARVQGGRRARHRRDALRAQAIQERERHPLVDVVHSHHKRLARIGVRFARRHARRARRVTPRTLLLAAPVRAALPHVDHHVVVRPQQVKAFIVLHCPIAPLPLVGLVIPRRRQGVMPRHQHRVCSRVVLARCRRAISAFQVPQL
mmetsp:Transcript_10709/g.35112  ORF Transcript_10709/g.35112 Transcript_10709/m.35112 type:complete len:257 (-) Transcript_10709:201-971(-)